MRTTPALAPGSASRDGAAQHAHRLARVAWTPKGDLEYREWVAAGHRLGAIGRGSQWWIGDWIRYGTDKWGEKYSEAARITGYDPHTLRNMAYVASRFDLSLRRDNLTWSHHVLLVSLARDEQHHWLDRAGEERMSVADLRIELRNAGDRHKRADRDTANSSHEPGAPAKIACPNCGYIVALPLAENPPSP
jgi:hypothetical protein